MKKIKNNLSIHFAECKKLISILIIMILLLGFMPLFYSNAKTVAPVNNYYSTGARAKPTGIQLNKKGIYLIKGKAFKLKVNGTKKAVKWSTSNSKVAPVNKNGVVVGKNKGAAIITAKVAGKSLKCKVIVETPKI